MEMAAAAWAFTKAAFAAVAAGTATAGQVATVIAVNVAGSMALSTAAAVLMKPKVGGRAPGEWVADPNAGIPFAIGPRIGVAGNIVYKNTFGKDNEYKGIVTVHSGAGPIGGYLGFTADREAIAFSGEAAQGRYGGEMWMQRRLGNQPDTALTSPASVAHKLPDWGPNHRLSGKAASLWTLRMDSKFSVYPQGEPAPLTTLIGIFGYDPRFDDTVPGGLGNCRWDDRSTWRTIQNGAIADLNWCLGLRENGKVVGGLGVSMAGVDLPAYMRAANVADANAWTVAAYPRSDESKTEVRAALLQSAGAVISRKAGKVSCISRGAPKLSVMTITGADTAGPIELDTAANVLNRLNSITPRYLYEASGWILAPAGPVSSSVYVDEDLGNLRSDARDYSYVPNALQAAQLAALDVAHSREGIAGRWPLKPYCRDIEVGEVFTVSEPGFLLNDQAMLCLEREYDPASDTVYVTFVSETAGKVEWAMGQTENPSPTPSLSAWQPLAPPTTSDWDVIVRPADPGGTSQPGVNVVGVVNNSRAAWVIVDHGPTEDGPWTQAYAGPSTVERIEIVGLQPGAEYWISIRYRSDDGEMSEREVWGPRTVGDLIAQPGGQGDMTPPGVPTGLSLSSTVETNATTGEPEVSIVATWTANTETDLAGYEVEIETGGAKIVEAAGTNRYSRRARSGSVYGIRLRAYDKAGNRSAWTAQQSIMGGLDTVPPHPPTALSVNASLGAFFVRWTAPGDSDVSAVEVYEATSNNISGAELVASVPALPFADGGVTVSRPTGTARWFFLRAIDTSKNRSAWTAGAQATIPSVDGASDILARSIIAGNVALGTLTGDLLQAQTVTADKFATTGALPVGLTVGPTGATLGMIDARAFDPAARVNEHSTLIGPGRIRITGTTDLTHWRDGPDSTEIRGGALAANSVAANRLEIGARGVTFDRFNFRTSGNTLSWDIGRAIYTNDQGVPGSNDVAGGSHVYSPSGGDITYIYWPKFSGTLMTTKSLGVAMNAGTVLIGSYYGGSLFTATYGKTIIDETGIITPSLAAITANLGTVTAGQLQNADLSYILNLTDGQETSFIGSGGVAYRGNAIGSSAEAIYLWVGPSSVPRWAATKANAWLGLSMNTFNGPRFFGSDVPGTGGGGPSVRTFPVDGNVTTVSPGAGFQTFYISPDITLASSNPYIEAELSMSMGGISGPGDFFATAVMFFNYWGGNILFVNGENGQLVANNAGEVLPGGSYNVAAWGFPAPGARTLPLPAGTVGRFMVQIQQTSAVSISNAQMGGSFKLFPTN